MFLVAGCGLEFALLRAAPIVGIWLGLAALISLVVCARGFAADWPTSAADRLKIFAGTTVIALFFCFGVMIFLGLLLMVALSWLDD